MFDVYVEPGLLAAIQPAMDVYAADLAAEGYQVTVQEFGGDAAALRAQLQVRWLTGRWKRPVRGRSAVRAVHHSGQLGRSARRDHVSARFVLHGSGRRVCAERDRRGRAPEGRRRRRPGDLRFADYDGQPAVTGAGESELINDYFAKVHAYRTGRLPYANRGLVFADDDWSSWGENEMDELYDTVEAINDAGETTRAGYLAALSQDYESVLEALHSWPQGHGVRVGSDWEYVFNYDVLQANPRPGFYNLFNCSGALFYRAG